MTRGTNMEHAWKVGDRVRALCDVGDYIRSGDVGTVAAIDCGGVLWCTWDNPVTPEFDEFGWCIRADEVAPADAAIAALSAPQPAAAGEEIMVNAAHDVYTLPLQPSGLSSGPRFVVHVPGPEQPAAVDEAMVERAARAWCAGTDTPFDQLPDAGKARCLEDMRVVLTAALAAQQGDSHD